jgi:response regulator RpfG family c-di-GMP phosphodiesterase
MNKMAEFRDPKETGPHVNRVASYSTAIYESWGLKNGLSAEEIEKNKDVMRMAAMLHDVGKVAIPDAILKKPAKLDNEEFAVMKMHTIYGAILFGEIYSDLDQASAIVALNHHERWDGNGYPGHVDISDCLLFPGFKTETGTSLGKKGEEIPLFGRIVSLADVYDALCSRRCYKQAWSQEDVLTEIRAESGRQFDPELVEVFFETLDEIHHLSSLYPDETGDAVS